MSCLASCSTATTCGLCSSVASGISKKSGINSSTHTKAWFQQQAVLRVSLGNFLFFCHTSSNNDWCEGQNDRHDPWHHGGWIAKMVIWILLVILMFFLLNVVITVYGTLSKFGAGLFLLVQVIILLDFTHSWNDAWVEKDEQKWYIASLFLPFFFWKAKNGGENQFGGRGNQIAFLAVSVGCYLAAFVFSGILFIRFNPSGQDCRLNIFFIIMRMVLAFSFGILALHPAVSPVNLEIMYAMVSIMNHPVSTRTLILGMLTTVFSVVYSALHAGSSTTLLSPPSSPKAGTKKPLLEGEDVEEGKEKERKARPISYSYSFFHLIFALASMYSAMLLSGWTSSSES